MIKIWFASLFIGRLLPVHRMDCSRAITSTHPCRTHPARRSFVSNLFLFLFSLAARQQSDRPVPYSSRQASKACQVQKIESFGEGLSSPFGAVVGRGCVLHTVIEKDTKGCRRVFFTNFIRWMPQIRANNFELTPMYHFGTMVRRLLERSNYFCKKNFE